MSYDEIKNRTVYMLCRTDGGNDIYIGSTSQSLGQRFREHKRNAGNPSRLKWYGGSKLYKKMRAVGVHNWKSVPLISIPCDRATICGCEQVWVKALGANLNTYPPVNDDLVRKENKRQYRRRNRGTKRYYCDLCGVACSDKSELKKHFDTLKHSCAWLNSVD